MSGLAESLIARMAAQRDLLQEMDERLSSVSAHVASPDESVSVEVDGLGGLTDLSLDPQALELEPEALGRLIVSTASEAARVALSRQDSLVEELNDRMRTLHDAPLTCWDGTTLETPSR